MTDRNIAIVGISCRLPGASSVAELWSVLTEGRATITEVPAHRTTPARRGTKWCEALGSVPLGRGIFRRGVRRDFPHEAAQMDPQQRLLLHVAIEALEDAGIVSAELAGSNTGVWVGITSYDFALLNGQRKEVSAHTATGGALCIAANRLSYALDLRGPSMAVDMACSSSLVALHLACQSLRSGEASTALVGGLNLLLSSIPFANFFEAHVLSPDGRCKTFDKAADGFVRGEGAVVLVLKRLARAIADRDRIYAFVRGSAGGRSRGHGGIVRRAT